MYNHDNGSSINCVSNTSDKFVLQHQHITVNEIKIGMVLVILLLILDVQKLLIFHVHYYNQSLT